MSTNVEFDETDIKILNMLIKDSRTKLTDIAQDCGTTSVSVINRIKKLKNLNVITGSTLFLNTDHVGLPVFAVIGVNIDSGRELEVLKALEEQASLVEPIQGHGEYDIVTIVFAKNISELDKIAFSLKEQHGASKVTINVISGIHLQFDNINLQPLKRKY
jgi:Lrp/AsnC family transcriptional regulator, regulator for asnA, asnC and gidA